MKRRVSPEKSLPIEKSWYKFKENQISDEKQILHQVLRNIFLFARAEIQMHAQQKRMKKEEKNVAHWNFVILFLIMKNFIIIFGTEHKLHKFAGAASAEICVCVCVCSCVCVKS